MTTVELQDAAGLLRVQELAADERRISVHPNRPEFYVGRRTWVTRYPLSLIESILAVKGLAYVCDEIARDEDPLYVGHHINCDVFSYLQPALLAGKRILDFGCGSGASTMVLRRRLPNSLIVGVELEERLLSIASQRASFYGFNDLKLVHSPSGTLLPEGLGNFDCILLSAVYEHLLPEERKRLLPALWQSLEPGGVLFVNQTPFRYSLVESHTTGLPFINYLPDRLALSTARKFSKRVKTNQNWEDLLRAGIRGGTIREIMGILTGQGAGQMPILLDPNRPEMKDRIDVWYQASSGTRWRGPKAAVRLAFKGFKALTGIEMTPSLSLALRKPAGQPSGLEVPRWTLPFKWTARTAKRVIDLARRSSMPERALPKQRG